jgi:hypothetical protein
MLIQYTVYLIVIMISSSLRGMASQTERYKYKYKYNIVDISDCVIILSLFYVY